MQPFLANIRHFLARLTLGQKIALGTLLGGSLLVLGGISYWAGQPDYALLFGGLAPEDANRIVESLREDAVKYDLRENGTAIYVSRENVYELRLRFAGEGLVSEGPAGYELFDQGTLGMTDFMQKLNMKRALEGELARTVASIKQVEVARVHLVIPERSPFRQAQNKPSASVVLQVVRGASLSAGQIEGIGALVSGAVEGLDPADVTVLDTRGNMLSDPDAGNPDLASSGNQLRMQQAVEARLTEKGQSMLDQVLGPGNAIVRVTAMLDFTRSVSEREIIDPESATVISEEKLEEDAGEGMGNANSAVRNYELSRTRERSEKSLGDIADLSVSVILNQKPILPPADAEGEPAEPTYESYAEEEVQEIERLVKNAVGFQEERGDRFAIHQTQFDTSGDVELVNEMHEIRRQEQMERYLRYGLMAVALLAAMLLIRSATRKMGTPDPNAPGLFVEARRRAALPPGDDADENRALPAHERKNTLTRASRQQLMEPEEEELALVEDIYTSKLSPEAKARLKAQHIIFEEVRDQILQEPEDTAELIRSWLAEDLHAETRTL